MDYEDINESFEVLKKKASEIYQKEDDIILSFIDIEDDEVKIEDKHDFEYMKNNYEEQKPLTINIK